MWYSKGHSARMPPGWDVRPWELPGNFRLDCEPHRGTLLRWLANAALLCLFSALGLLVATPLLWLAALPFTTEAWWVVRFTVAAHPWFAVAGTLIGLLAWLLARRELGGMRAGQIDPAGEWDVRFARDRGRTTFIFAPLLLLPYVLIHTLG